MEASYDGITSRASYYVPLEKSHEVWALTLTNHSDRPRSLTLTGYAEFTNHSNYEQDQVNLQYSLFIGRTLFKDNRIVQQIHGNLDALASEEQIDEKNVTERFFGLAGAAVSSYCGDKEHFLGKYQNYSNPQGISSGSLGNALSYNENSCGALSCIVTLAPEETTTIAFLLGEKYSDEAENIITNYTNAKITVKRELAELKSHWQEKLEIGRASCRERV